MNRLSPKQSFAGWRGRRAERRQARDTERMVRAFLPDAEEIGSEPDSPMARATLYALLALVVCLVVWARVAQVDRVVVARGKLVTEQSTLLVQPLEAGVIRALHVMPGQVVRRGEPLVALDPTFVSADMAQLRGRQADLVAEIRRLNAEIGDAPAFEAGASPAGMLQARLFGERRALREARLRQFDETLARTHSVIETGKRDARVLGERLVALGEIEGMRAVLLEKESGSRLRLLESREQRLAMERELKLTEGRMEEQRRQAAATMAERAAFLRDWQQQALDGLVKAERDLSEVKEQLGKAVRRGQLVDLVAPEDGIVLEVAKLSVGSVAKEAEPLITLVPLGALLKVEARIQALDIGFVEIGAPVHVKVDAFPFQKHGTLQARLRTISPDAFQATQSDMARGQGEEAYYVARLDVDDGALRQMPRHARLIPGMTVSAEIVVGQRSVISYFLYPLFRTLDESIREP